MEKYNNELARVLHEDKTSIKMYGIEIGIKNIPDQKKPGVMDPREYEIAKANLDFFKQNKSTNPSKHLIDDIRNSMGFPNLNLNTIEIYTKYEEIHYENSLLKLWIYYPRRPIGKTNRSCFIYIHGGGWIGGTPFAVENPCRLLAERANCVVFNIDYSLAPECPYPQGFNDCYNALKYIYENADKYGVDNEKICMGGDSAGGNLTAACAMKDRDLGTNMLKYEALIYPAVTMFSNGYSDYKWRLEDYEISLEQKDVIESNLSLGRPTDNSDKDPMVNLYLQNGEDIKNPYISPLAAESHKNICKTLIAVAEFDGLRIQGEIYGKRLLEANVDTRILRYKGVCHAFIDKLGILPQAEDLIQEIADDMISIFA